MASTMFATAFSLLGPLQTPATATWQVQAIGYQLPGDIGGPMDIIEGYRWNVPSITYAFDSAFLNYFGQEGVNAIQEGLDVINNLGPVSQLSPDLNEFPIEAIKANPAAASLGLIYLKSTALAHVLEILGLADPTRWVWTLRTRQVRTNPNATNYLVIQRNFDPITYTRTAFINDDQYNYTIVDPIQLNGQNIAIAFPEPASLPDPLPLSKPVASFLGSGFGFGGAAPGLFVTGLSRDDAGGLRFLYRGQNRAVENLLPDVTFASNNFGNVVSPWIPYFGITNIFTNVVGNTNITSTNLLVVTGLRPGIETLHFTRIDYDSLLGQTVVPITNIYTDVYLSNNVAVMQRVQRVSSQPDIIFTAQDLGVTPGGAPVLTGRGVTFINNDALNPSSVLAGPGVLSSPATISFTTLLPAYFNSQPNLLSGPQPGGGLQGGFLVSSWGSFGESDAITVYPSRFSIEELEALLGF